MKDKGEQDKPLIISEYGILWPSWLKDENGVGWSPARVSYFMTQTFDLFLYEAYPDVGYPQDDYRLVQAWAWYSLCDDAQYNGYLFRSSTKQLSPMGQAYGNYTAALPDTPYTDLTVRLWAGLQTLESLTSTPSCTSPTVTIPVTGMVSNIGTLTATNIVVSSSLLDFWSTLNAPARYAGSITPLPLPSLVLTQSGWYHLSLIADPAQALADPRRWNNTFTATVDARSDLEILTTTWSVEPAGDSGGMLNVTATIAHRWLLSTPPVSGTLWMSDTHGTLFLPWRFSVPALSCGEQVTITKGITLPGLSGDIYDLALQVDSDGILDEKDESNNWVRLKIDGRPDLAVSVTIRGTELPQTTDGWVSVTLTITNTGLWPTLPTSGALSMGNIHNTLLLPVQHFPIPALDAGAQVTIPQESIIPASNEDIYRIGLEVDSDDILNERDEDNNQTEIALPIVVTTTVQTDIASVLTSASGHTEVWFPAGTVTTPTEIRFMPLLPSGLSLGSMAGVAAFRLVAYWGGQPVSLTLLRPVTVTWQYTDTDVMNLDEQVLELYHLTGDGWQQITCPTEQRQPENNRLNMCIQELGTYVFGVQYRRYLPLVLHSVGGDVLQAHSPELQRPEAVVFSGIPLRLPPWATSPAPP